MRARSILAVFAVLILCAGPLHGASDKEPAEREKRPPESTEGSETARKDAKRDKRKNAAEKGGKGSAEKAKKPRRAKASKGEAADASGSSPQAAPPEEASAPSAAPEKPAGTGTLRGRVLNDAGVPVRGSEVDCIDERGIVVARTVTDENGIYEFSGLRKGEYTVSVRSPGTAGPVEIGFPDSSKKPPAPPLKLAVRELERGEGEGRAVRAEWEKAKHAAWYRCELYRKGEPTPLASRSGMLQSFCEFEDLDEGAEYEIRVFAENEYGSSERSASAVFRTAYRPPPPPTGLSVTFAKNNRVDLSWNAGRRDRLRGYAVQLAKGSGSYMYYTPQGVTSDRSKAFIVDPPESGEARCTIEGASIVENLVPYSFRVFAIDARGIFSKASSPVTGIVPGDTVPPQPPVDLRYEFSAVNRLKVMWKAADKDTVRYRVSYGFDRERWDGVAFTEATSFEFVFDPARLKDAALFVNVTAIDRAGNESGIKPILKRETVTRGETEAGDIVVTARDLFKDRSGALRQLAKPPKTEPASGRKAPPREAAFMQIGFSDLKSAGFTVQKGIQARIGGRIRMPENAVIRVMPGGSLIVDGAELDAEGGSWGGIRFGEGSTGVLKNSVLRGAATGLWVENNDGGVRVLNIQVHECAESGIFVKNSRIELAFVDIRGCRVGVSSDNSAVTVSDSTIRLNERGILANDYRLSVIDSKIEGNREYGIRLYGGGRIERCVVRNNLAGIVLEQGRGSAVVVGCRIELNTVDGIVSSARNADIAQNLIASNGRHGIFLREGANPNISGNDIVNNRGYGVFGGGRIARSFVAYNNGSPYYDDTEEKGRPDNVFSSSSSGPVKQIEGADYIVDLSISSVLR